MNDTGTGQDTEARGNQKLDLVIRLLLIIAGIALIVSGVTLAFRNGNGVSTAALLAAGFALAFMAYVGHHLTSIRFRDFEATMDRVQARLDRVGTKADETAQSLESLASRYNAAMTDIAPGGERDSALEEILADAENDARAGKVTKKFIAELAKQKDDPLSRIRMLGYMKGDPALRDPEIVFDVIANPNTGFDQDRFLLLAGEMLHNLDDEQRRKLKEVILQQQAHGQIKRTRIRWLTAERLLRLIER